MRLINYNYGYIAAFDCSINGKILITEAEWIEARLFLLRGARRWLPSYPWIAGRIKEDEKRKIPVKKNKYLINIRVPATSAIAKKYNLHGYKPQNYMLEIGKVGI